MARSSADENVIRSTASSRRADEERPPGAARLAAGSMNRSVRNRTSSRPTGTEPPNPTTRPSATATLVRARATRCSRYGQPSPGRSGQSIGSPLAARIAAMAGTSSASRRPHVHRPCGGHRFAQPVVRDGVGRDAVAPDDGRRRDERVDDRLLHRLDGRVEEPVDHAPADGPHVVGPDLVRIVRSTRRRQSIAGREGDEQVAARVPAGAAGPRDPEAGSLGEPLALVGEQRSVGRDDDDDRARTWRRRQRPPGDPHTGLGTSDVGIASPTRTPSTRSQSRLP